MPDRQAPLQLNFIIVGGGIPGLALAYELSRSGHRVHLLEKSSGLDKRSGGIRVPPNFTTILLNWGLEDKLKASSTQCRGTTFHSLYTGEPVGHMSWSEDVLQMTGADFLLMHRQDLYRMIHDLASAAGAEITFDTRVVAVHQATDAQNPSPTVVLSNGEVLQADIVVGADGPSSIVRPIVTKKKADHIPTGMSAYTATIPMELAKDSSSAVSYDKPEWPIWMGSSRNVLCHPIREGTELSIQIFWPDDETTLSDKMPADESWEVTCPSDVLKNVGQCDRGIQKLISFVPSFLRTPYVKCEESSEWVDSTGRIILLGNAAHSLMPCGTHSPALAVEDAVVFGTLFAHLREMDQLPHLTTAYQELRQARCKMVYSSELTNTSLVWMASGPEQEARDEEMRQSLPLSGGEVQDENALRAQWEDISEIFGYNAREAAEDWYVQWGVLRERSRADSFQAEAVGYAIKQVSTTTPVTMA